MTILLYVLCFCCVVFAALSIITDNPRFFIASSVSIVLAYVCACNLPNKKEPSKLYKEKVEAVEKANRELEIFLIDYPEFREE